MKKGPKAKGIYSPDVWSIKKRKIFVTESKNQKLQLLTIIIPIKN